MKLYVHLHFHIYISACCVCVLCVQHHSKTARYLPKWKKCGKLETLETQSGRSVLDNAVGHGKSAMLLSSGLGLTNPLGVARVVRSRRKSLKRLTRWKYKEQLTRRSEQVSARARVAQKCGQHFTLDVDSATVTRAKKAEAATDEFYSTGKFVYEGLPDEEVVKHQEGFAAKDKRSVRAEKAAKLALKKARKMADVTMVPDPDEEYDSEYDGDYDGDDEDGDYAGRSYAVQEVTPRKRGQRSKRIDYSMLFD